MNEATKDLAYFQQQVAEKYDCLDWGNLALNIEMKAEGLPYSISYAFAEAAEAYAAYRFEQGEESGLNKRINEFENGYAQGKKEGFEQGKQAGIEQGIKIMRLADDRSYKQAELKGWNEAVNKIIIDVEETSDLATHNKSVFLLYLKTILKQEEE